MDQTETAAGDGWLIEPLKTVKELFEGTSTAIETEYQRHAVDYKLT